MGNDIMIEMTFFRMKKRLFLSDLISLILLNHKHGNFTDSSTLR